MKRFFTLLLLAATTILFSFSPSFQAPPFSYTEEHDLTGQIWETCTESIQITEGSFTWEDFGFINGKSVNYRWHYSIHAKAVGLETGKQYVINQEGNHAQAGEGQGGQFTIKHTETFLVVGAGSTTKQKFDYKRAFNADGEITASFRNFRSACE